LHSTRSSKVRCLRAGRYFGGARSTQPWTTIVGVVADVRHHHLASAFVPMVYVPVTQVPERSLTMVARLGPSRPTSGRLIAEAVRGIS
jgi:hypothetical protein